MHGRDNLKTQEARMVKAIFPGSNFSLNSVHFKEKLCVVYISSEDAIKTLFEDNPLQ